MLTDDLVHNFHRDGFAVAPDLLDAGQRDQVRQWTTEIAGWPDDPSRWLHHRELVGSAQALTRTENILPYHAGLRELLQGTLAQAVGDLFGEPALVFKEKINYKQPGGAGYAAHQDAPAYPMGTRHITCMLAVDDAAADNGCLDFAAGWHKQGLLDMGDDGCIAPAVADTLDWRPAPCPAGGALFFDSYTPHRSGPNRSDRPRCMLYITYNAASEGDLRQAYYDRKATDLQAGRVSLIGHFQGQVV